jgi:hypothetical protein
MAASEASKQAIWLRRVFGEFRLSVLGLPPILHHMGNQGAMAIDNQRRNQALKAY